MNPAPKQDLFFKYLPLLSPLIVIFTFVFNNWYTARTKRAESRRTWYFKAYFEPQVKKVEEFFSNADREMKAALDLFQQEADKRTDVQTLELITTTLYNLANSKRKFELEVVRLFQSTYPNIFDKLESTLMNFEDSCTKAFEEGASDPYFTFIEEINQIKSQLLNSLSGPALK